MLYCSLAEKLSSSHLREIRLEMWQSIVKNPLRAPLLVSHPTEVRRCPKQQHPQMATDQT